jgi:hypothetical protein
MWGKSCPPRDGSERTASPSGDRSTAASMRPLTPLKFLSSVAIR